MLHMNSRETTFEHQRVPAARFNNIFLKLLDRHATFFFFFFNNMYLVTTLLMTILTFTWRKNKNNVQEIKEKYDVTAFATN